MLIISSVGAAAEVVLPCSEVLPSQSRDSMNAVTQALHGPLRLWMCRCGDSKPERANPLELLPAKCTMPLHAQHLYTIY
jgi:hypothetical protein